MEAAGGRRTRLPAFQLSATPPLRKRRARGRRPPLAAAPAQGLGAALPAGPGQRGAALPGSGAERGRSSGLGPRWGSAGRAEKALGFQGSVIWFLMCVFSFSPPPLSLSSSRCFSPPPQTHAYTHTHTRTQRFSLPPPGRRGKPNLRPTKAFGIVACAPSGTALKPSNAASAMSGKAPRPGMPHLPDVFHRTECWFCCSLIPVVCPPPPPPDVLQLSPFEIVWFLKILFQALN